MSKRSRIPKALLGALAVAVVGWAGSAMAQDCTVSLADPNCYHLKGSDTLFDIMTTAINNARTASVPGSKNLAYDGSGSGNAENQMKNNSGTGAPVSGASIPLGVQSIGPMSRNFRPATVDALSVGFAQADGATTTKQGHASWAPACQNVVGLDAAVFAVRTSTGCKDIDFNQFLDNAIPNASTERAVANNASLPTTWGNNTAFNNKSSTVNYSSLLMVVLSGVDGSGTIAACSDPRRVQALTDLAGCLGVNDIEHLYRRDDNSGTTNTWQDRIMIVPSSADPRYPWIGGRFCNGTAFGGINGATSQTGVCSVTRSNTTCKVNSDCPTGEVCQFNLNNEDFDPIRRACVASDATHAPTSCTDMTTGKPCQASDNNSNCTQGLIVALTDTDPGAADITDSIRQRINLDSTGQSVGYAGLEVVLPGKNTKGLTMNTTGFSAANVRKGAYLLSRRLFLQNALVAGQPVGDQPSDTAGPNIGITGKGQSQLTAEQNLFLYMTDPGGSMSGGSPGRFQTDPIVKQFNFITCSTDPSIDPCTLSNNLCAETPSSAVASPLSAYTPNGSVGAGGAGGTISIDSQGRLYNPSTGTAAQTTCTGTALCASGQACSGGLCPLANNRPSFSACTSGADCASGTCTDILGIGIPGQPISLLCQ